MLLDKDRRGIPYHSGWTEEPKWRKELRKKPSTEESYLVRQKNYRRVSNLSSVTRAYAGRC